MTLLQILFPFTLLGHSIDISFPLSVQIFQLVQLMPHLRQLNLSSNPLQGGTPQLLGSVQGFPSLNTLVLNRTGIPWEHLWMILSFLPK